MRSFVGCPLSAANRALLGAWMAEHLQRGWRPVPPANLHLTLGFFGDQPAALLDTLANRLRSTPLPPTCRVRSDRAVPFPAAKSPLLALELTLTTEFLALHTAIGAASAGVGLPWDTRPFRPHITLARGHGNAIDEPIDIELNLTEVCIYSSIPEPGGRRYQALDCVQLASAGA